MASITTDKYPAKDHVARTIKTLISSLLPDEISKPQAILLAGSATSFRNDTDRELPFRQESNFFYLSGCSVPSSFLLIVYDPTTNQLSGYEGLGLRGSLTSILYIPNPTIADLMWSPAPPTLDEARVTYAVDLVLHHSSLDEALNKLPEGTLVHTLPLTEQLPSIFTCGVEEVEKAASTIKGKENERYLLPALHKTRLIKDEYEIGLIRRANAISSRAHEVVMRVLGMAVQRKIKHDQEEKRSLMPAEWLIEKEAEAEAIFVASCRREGAVHQSYLPIVAASTRASTLHYCCNDRAFAWGPVKPGDQNTGVFITTHMHEDGVACGGNTERELLPQVLLIDAGCEWECYSSDITRTMPVGNGGKFTAEAKQVYTLVLKMQSESFNYIRPGVHWDDVQLLCHRVLVDGFLDMGIFKDPVTAPRSAITHGNGNENAKIGKSRADLVEEILRTGLSAAFFPHGVGHSMGMDVHDVPSASRPQGSGKYFVGAADNGDGGHEDFYKYLRLRLPLEVGMVVTVEPGVYFHPHLLAHHAVHTSSYIDTAVLGRYEGMGGVRIEDDVLITDTNEGYVNLTTVGSEVGWLEEVCGGVA